MTTPEDPTDSPMGGAPAAQSLPPPGPMSYPPGPPPPPPGPTGYAPPPTPRRNRSNWIALGVLLVIIVVAVGGFWLFRDRISGNVTDLALGDCFDESSEQTITDVQHQPCTSPHDGEVFAVLTHPAGGEEPYPVVSGFDDYIQQNCIPLWEAYTARTWATDTELSLNYLHPTLSGWADGDRGFTCYTTRADEAKLNGSVRSIGSSPLP